MLIIASCKEADKDSKVMDNSKDSSVVSLKEPEKINKNEKRAPLIMTAVPGEMKYTPENKYRPELKYTIQPTDLYNQFQYTIPSQSPDTLAAAVATQTTKPQYFMYSPPPQPPQMLLMLAVPHPSGQFLMLLPAQNFIYPMFYRPQPPALAPPLAQLAPVSLPPSSYQTPTYQQQPQTPLSQAAGFVAQHQLAYSGPYRTEKYTTSSKQN